MAFDTNQIHVYGGDEDKVWVGPVEGADAATLGLADPSGDYEHLGFLGEDGITLTPSDTVEKFRAHQGAKVVRTKMTESETTFEFIALQDNVLVANLQFDVLDSDTVDGVTTRRLSSSRKVTRHSFIIDLYDNDVHKRYYVPIGEIGERSEISFSNSELTAYSFSVEVIDEMYEITNDAALAGDGVS